MKIVFYLILFVYNLCSLIGQTAQLNINITTSKYSCIPGKAKIDVTGGIEPYYFNWSNGAHGAEQEHLGPGDYFVSLVQGNGKDTTLYVKIEEEKCKVSFDASFSPNGDGINDTWKISNSEYYPDFRLYIYNRWGQLVNKQQYEFLPWDGKQFEIDLPVGAYYFVFFYSSKNDDAEKGSIVIMR